MAAAVVALWMIYSANPIGDDADKPGSEVTQQQQEPEPEQPTRPRRAVYVVKDGDTLLGIASKTGVPVSRLEELNPEIDPLRLFAGQRIKLR